MHRGKKRSPTSVGGSMAATTSLLASLRAVPSAVVGALALAACSCGAGTAAMAPSGSASGSASGSTSGAPSAAGSGETPGGTAGAYDVHEWGLMRALPGDVLSAGAIAPPRRIEPMTVDKPVLYFHADAPLTLSTVNVDASGGAIAEVWPEPPRTGEAWHVTWRDVALDPTGACAPSALPLLTDPTCTSLPAGELCEVASLGVVRVPGVACVRTAGVVDSLLFYRARTSSFTPPLRFERSPAVYEEVSVTNEGTLPIPGWLVRLSDTYGSVRALAVRPPGPGETLVVGADFARAADTGLVDDEAVADMPVAPGSPEPGRIAVRASMIEIGLTDGEADAFLRAWDRMLFGVEPTAADRTVLDVLTADDMRTTDEDGELAPAESFVYFLPEASVDGVARLTFDPPPRTVYRAMAIWSPLRSVGASH